MSDIVREVAKLLQLARAETWRQRPVAIEVGALARVWMLREFPATDEQRYSLGGQLGPILGVPVVERSDMDPRAWRIVNEDGQAFSSGLVPHDLESLAQLAYAAYLVSLIISDGLNYEGKPCPTWNGLASKTREAWRAAADAVCMAESQTRIG